MPKKYGVKFTERAIADLDEITDYLLATRSETASRFLVRLRAGIFHLERFPHRCSFIKEITRDLQPVRHLLISNYRVLFKVDGRSVQVMRVMHGARKLKIRYFKVS